MTPESESAGIPPLQFTVPEEFSGQRLDFFLAGQIPGVSRVRVRRSIDQGGALVEGMPQKASYRLSVGENISIALSPSPASGPEPEPIPLDILYEDAAIAVINKPARMVVHPAKGHWSGTLAGALVHHFDQLSQHGGATRPGIVHRLDRDTSGVIVVAKTDAAHQHLAEQFQNRTVEKEYLAIVLGKPDRDRDLIEHAVAKHPTHREKMALLPDGPTSRPAQTFYEVEERFPGFALIRSFPKTGRTHQIRLHLASIRCPVLCDKLYGGRAELTLGELRSISRCSEIEPESPPEKVLLDRQALHAHVLRIRHPMTDESLEFCTELPSDLMQVLILLREAGSLQ